jgi:hypothetical protein
MSSRRRLPWRQVQGTDAALAHRVGGDIEPPPEFDSGITVDDFDFSRLPEKVVTPQKLQL